MLRPGFKKSEKVENSKIFQTTENRENDPTAVSIDSDWRTCSTCFAENTLETGGEDDHKTILLKYGKSEIRLKTTLQTSGEDTIRKLKDHLILHDSNMNDFWNSVGGKVHPDSMR